MTSQDYASGFEALLKPLQDITSKIWDIVLTKALENYLTYTNDSMFVNFTEAAVLVQNSASFYCKRVDLVHLGCQQFVEQLTDLYNKVFGSNRIMDCIIHDFDAGNGKENGDVEGEPVKKKRTVKTFISNDFEPMHWFFSDCNIDVNLEKISKNVDKGKIILNKYPKVTRKANTSCPVYQSKGSEMGLKEEFRLHWGISSNGVLNEDFITTRTPMLLDWCALPDDVHEVLLENSLMDLDSCIPNNLEVMPPCSPLDRGPSPELLNEQVLENSPIPNENILPEKPTIQDPYKDLVFNFVLPIRPLAKKQCFNLPKSLIDEVNDWKLRTIEMKAEANNPMYMFDNFFNYMKHRELNYAQSASQVKVNLSAKQRRKEILLRKKYYERHHAASLAEFDEDFHGYEDGYGENNAEDIEIGEVEDLVADLVAVDIPDVQSNAGSYSQNREALMADFQENKRRNAAEMTEVARRVQEWHESLAHVLETAESRAQFDVHDYGTRILENFDEPPEKHPTLSFQKIVENENRPEISRFLLSALMLANTYNVEIIQPNSDLVKDSLKLKLLSTVRHHEEMDDNLASQH